MKDEDKQPAAESAKEQPAGAAPAGGGWARAMVGMLIGGLILGGSAYAAWHFWQTRPEARTFKPPRAPLHVEAMRLKRTTFDVVIPSQGRVKARAVSGIVPEVAGRIVKISPAFREGGFFKTNQVLLWLDDSNYRHAVAEASATVRQLQAKLELERINRSSYTNAAALSLANRSKSEAVLELELARQSAAIANLKLLGTFASSTPLARNEPQVKEARAAMQASLAELAKAELDLKKRPGQMEADLQAQIDAAGARLARAQSDLNRTVVRAPSFPGRIVEKNADAGQYVSPGTTLARAIAVDYAEVRLPVPSSLLEFLDSPDPILNEDGSEAFSTGGPGPAVTILARLGGREHSWPGNIVRGEARVNQSSQQNFVIARVANPYGKSPVLKDGQFVRAHITGNPLEKVFVIPRTAVRRGNFVLLIDADDKLRRHRIISLWRDENAVVARQVIGVDGQPRDLKEGEVLCLTNVDFAANGDKVAPTIDGVPPPKPQPGAKGGPRKK